MARYSSTAVNALYTLINSGIAAKLTTVETENSLTAGDLPAPTVIKHFAPFDPRVPLIQIFVEEFSPDQATGGQRNGVYNVQCKTVLTYKGDAELATHEIRVQLYAEALIRVVLADPTLGGLVIHAILGSVRFHQDAINDSATLHMVSLDWLVGVQSTTGG